MAVAVWPVYTTGIAREARMKRRHELLVMGSALLLAIGGVAIAATGYKYVLNMPLGDPEFYDVSIPPINIYTDLVSIFNDINGSPGCPIAEGGVTGFLPDGSLCSWTGPFSCNRPFRPGEGIRLSFGPGGCSGWVIVGGSGPIVTPPIVGTLSAPLQSCATSEPWCFVFPQPYPRTPFIIVNPQLACLNGNTLDKCWNELRDEEGGDGSLTSLTFFPPAVAVLPAPGRES